MNYKSDSNPNVDNSIDNDYTNTSKDKPMVNSSNPTLGNPSIDSLKKPIHDNLNDLNRMNMGLTDTSNQGIPETGDNDSQKNEATRNKK